MKEPVAVLFQATTPPVIGGARKPMKPGGYSDSGADIAFNLRAAGVSAVTPVADPDPAVALDWVFPDTAEGISEAVAAGANVLWANTILFRGHALEFAPPDGVHVVGQRPEQVHKFDDKLLTNRLLRSEGLPVASSMVVCETGAGQTVSPAALSGGVLLEHGMSFPLIVKPVRGRGSEGVRRVDSFPELKAYVAELLSATVVAGGQTFPAYGDELVVEEYLPGSELTLTVMPPGGYTIGGAERVFTRHWALPPVKRFNHENGVAPYNGVVAVIRNSSLLDEEERSSPAVQLLQRQCCEAALLVGATAPIRIDCRESSDGTFRLFDLNMKPNMTGPGRPGREDQDSLTSLAGRAIGWTFQDLLKNMLRQAWPVARPASR